MNKVDVSVGTLIDMIARGELRLPEMQRRYVWRASRVRDLLDSLYRGYPSGAILVWETTEQLPMRDLAVEQAGNNFSINKLLLDGQQRLTSLSAVLRGEAIKVRNRKRPIEILFNLDHPDSVEEIVEVDEEADDLEDEELEDDEEDEGDEVSLQERLRQLTFVVSSKAMKGLPNWVSVSDVMKEGDAHFLKNAGVTSLDDPRYSKYSERLKRLRDIRAYPYVMHLLDRTLSYEEVAEIFVRVNSLGMKLRSSDLALAQITARWKNLLPALEAFQEECEKRNFTIDLGMLVRSMVVFATGQCRFKTLGSVTTQRLQDGWAKAKEGLRFAVNFLSANGGVEDEELLSSPFFLPALAYAFDHAGGKLSQDDERTLLKWVFIGSGRGYFGGSSETKLDADLARLRSGAGPSSLLKNLEQQFGRLNFDEGDIAGRGKASGLYGLTYLALKKRGAKDWKSGLGISLLHKGRQHLLQSHHIFPKALVRDKYPRREVNEIANRAFIGGRTNRGVSATPPVDYLPTVIKERGSEALVSQCVPVEPALWNVDAYPKFLAWRRAELVKAINAMLDNL